MGLILVAMNRTAHSHCYYTVLDIVVITVSVKKTISFEVVII